MRPGKAQRRRVLTEKHSEELQQVSPGAPKAQRIDPADRCEGDPRGASGCLAGGGGFFHKL